MQVREDWRGTRSGAQPPLSSPSHCDGAPAQRYPVPGHWGVGLRPDFQLLSGTLKQSLIFFLEVCILKQINLLK